MKKIIIIGGSRGIGKAIAQTLLPSHLVVNISRTAPEYSHPNLSHLGCDVISQELPEIASADALIYCPGSINLKPFKRIV